MNFKNSIVLLFFLTSVKLASQELPTILKFPTSVYNAGNQNWMISQDKNNFMYFANNKGLLEFNGENWLLYPSPNETIMRSVSVIGNRIYTGSYMEFGYWNRASTGRLYYKSLSRIIKNKIVEDEQFWNIIEDNHWILFQSLNRIYIYDTVKQSFKIIIAKNNIVKSYKTKTGIYFQVNKVGLFSIRNGKSILISDDLFIKNNLITSIISLNNGIFIQSQLNGMGMLTGNKITNFLVTNHINSSNIYSCLLLKDGNIALGTVSDGVFIISQSGKLIYHFTQSKGMSNNTALSLFEDIDSNLWVGLDNGINCINLHSPIKKFTDITGAFGTVYASIMYQEKLYIGTNQGLFVKKYNTEDEFEFISGTKGQVWSLFENDNTLFCGHDSGTFVIENNTSKKIFSESGTWKFETIPNQENILIQGNYFGLSVLEKINNNWIFKNKIKGFDFSARYFEITNDLEIYVSHEYKGIFRFHLDKKFQKIATHFFTYANPTKSQNAALTKFNDNIYYANKNGIFKLDENTKYFKKDLKLSQLISTDEYTTGKIIVDKSNKLWIFSKNYLNYLTLGNLSDEMKQECIPISSSLINPMIGFENITFLSKNDYLIGSTDGFYKINLDDFKIHKNNIIISNININKRNQTLINCDLNNNGDFSYDQNNIYFGFTVAEYNGYINAEYQYLLEGFQEDWSKWNAKANINFKNLTPGTYTFKVKSKTKNSNTNNLASYTFTIRKPWYANNLMMFVYFTITFLIAIYIHKAYKSYYQKQRENLIEENNLLLEMKELENEHLLMKIKNEKLEQDMNFKNKELAISTMSLIKKDELLALMKIDSKISTTEDGSKKSIVSKISRNTPNDNSWNVFREAFDLADNNFFKKIKFLHPTLTPNDLRLCAYLRLNLSSKEVAPLINISVRSVEIKRYRLRMKMKLTHEQGLVEYILSI